MATQDEPGIPFSIGHDQQVLRLMELPPELAVALSGPDPPVLHLGSSFVEAQADSPAMSQAILTAGDSVFQIRQVSTSNSVFLLQPNPTPGDGEGPEVMGLTAVATVGNILELLPDNGASAATSRKWHDKFKQEAP